MRPDLEPEVFWRQAETLHAPDFGSKLQRCPGDMPVPVLGWSRQPESAHIVIAVSITDPHRLAPRAHDERINRGCPPCPSDSLLIHLTSLRRPEAHTPRIASR